MNTLLMNMKSLVNAMVEHAQARYEQLLAQGQGPEARLRAYLDARLALEPLTKHRIHRSP
ncbi:MAG: hypothetical protein HEQ39_06535 [Rhizobacter sp.]